MVALDTGAPVRGSPDSAMMRCHAGATAQRHRLP